MARDFLVIDIETVPDSDLYTAPEVAAGVERPFPPLYAHRPIVLGVLLLDDKLQFRRLGVIGEGKDELATLRDFASYVDEKRPHLVTYNGRAFDLPVLAMRCMRFGVSLPFYFQDKDYRYRYSDYGHLDLFDAISDHGAARIGSLDAMARVIGLPGKVGVDGSQVEGLYNAGQLDSVKNYCLSDVVQTTFLFLRYRLLQGAWSLDEYRRTASALRDTLLADPRVSIVMEKIDPARLLLL